MTPNKKPQLRCRITKNRTKSFLLESVNETPICFSGECFECLVIQITENISLSELKSTLSEAILHLCWNIKLLPKTTKKIKCISNFLGILNWMLQTLHHYCRKQHKKQKLTSYRTECYDFLPFCVLTAFRAIYLIQW